MPDTFLVQKTYEGFRKLILGNHKTAYFQRIDDWRKAGSPFFPVTQKFFTYFIGFKKIDYVNEGIPVSQYILKTKQTTNQEKLNKKQTFQIKNTKYLQLSKDHTNFTISDNNSNSYVLVSKKGSMYKGREGIEFYPQELFLFDIVKVHGNTDVVLKNKQFKKSKYKIPSQQIVVETKFIRPLIKGASITPFHFEASAYTFFPYEQSISDKVAISEAALRNLAPKTYRFFKEYESVFNEQNSYSRKMINGKHIPFYSLARVGKYSFSDYNVVFRDNTKNAACVVSTIDTPLGKLKPVFQNHAVTISQRPDGEFISKPEAYYIAGIMNCDVVNRFIKDSSDSRSFPINPRYQIPLYGIKEVLALQNQISELSHIAHKRWNDPEAVSSLKQKISKLYIKLLSQQLKSWSFTC